MSDATLVEVNAMIHLTDHWGFVETPYGELYLAGNDDGIALRFFHGKDYEPESLLLWSRLCAGKIVIDVGAHTGIYSLAAYLAGASWVYSIEPYYMNIARLKMNLRKNGYGTKCCLYACASDHDGMTMLSVNGTPYYCTAGAHMGPHEQWPMLPVPSLALDTLPIIPDVVKIDVEGFELAVLKGMSRILESRPDLIIESTEHAIADILKPFGYTFSLLDERNVYATVKA